MKRCTYCYRFIWPWQRRGWIVGVADWHSACYRAQWTGFFGHSDR